MVEAICAYAMIDKPNGFLKIALEALSDLLGSIRSMSLLSNSSVHPGVTQLLRCICRNINNWKFEENNKPDMVSIKEQEPYTFDCTLEVLELINSIAKRVSDEPFLIKVFFSSHTDILHGETSERVCLPFQILITYFKYQQKGILQIEEKATLRSVLLKSLQSMCKDSTFSEFMAHESDFIDILMLILSS